MLFKAFRTNKNTGEEKGQDASSSQTPQDKAKARRAQVRTAQIEHRQRKANYVKQLEIDVARIRDMIAATQMESRLLLAENDAMRSQLFEGESVVSQACEAEAQRTTSVGVPECIDRPLIDGAQLSSLSDVTLSLALDDAMNLPVYQISSERTSSNCQPNTHLNTGDHCNSEPPSYPFAHLSPEQTQQIINFILA